MKPEPPRASATLYASPAVAIGTTWSQASSIHPRRPARTTTAAPAAPAAMPQTDAVTDLLHDEPDGARSLTAPASACATARTMKKSGTQMPSLSPLSTLSPCRTRDGSAGSVTTACPSAASVGARTTASRSASAQVSEPSRTSADAEAGHDRQRQADPEQTRRDRDLVTERAQVDPRGVAEEHDRERRLRQQLHRLAGHARVDEPERVDADDEPDRGEHHRAREWRAGEPPGQGRVAEQRDGDRREGPGHALRPLLAAASGAASGVRRGRRRRSSRSSRRRCHSRRSSSPAPSAWCRPGDCRCPRSRADRAP